MLAAIRCGKGDLEANLASHLHVLGEARAADCDLVLFPEMSLTGSVDPATHPERLITLSHPAVRELTAAAAGTEVAICFGIAERDPDGEPRITQPVMEQFVPQMVNFDVLGGVNFRKGCYPGQEVVARSQFRGTLKRRTYLVQADAPVSAGQEVFAAGDAEQPVGTVAQAAPAPDGGWSALISMQIAALEAGGLRVGSADGAALTVEPLPYPLLEDI